MADARAWLLVGLGNPGAKYSGNRHNVGFMAVDRWLADELPLPPVWKTRWRAEAFSFSTGQTRCVAAKPQTFMNKSGDSVAELVSFHQVDVERIVVVHDELDFEFGRVALKRGGGHGGHNGLRDIIDRIGTRDFLRIRVGIGRPERGDVSNWVLSNFASDQASALDEALRTSSKMISSLLAAGLARTMNEFNTAAGGTA